MAVDYVRFRQRFLVLMSDMQPVRLLNRNKVYFTIIELHLKLIFDLKINLNMDCNIVYL